jgi:hypothetical protein
MRVKGDGSPPYVVGRVDGWFGRCSPLQSLVLVRCGLHSVAAAGGSIVFEAKVKA